MSRTSQQYFQSLHGEDWTQPPEWAKHEREHKHMSTVAKAKGDFEQLPAGTYPAWCYSVVDIGYQRNSYQGTESTKEQIIVSFEFPTCQIEIDGEKKPMIMSTFYTLSLSSKANLRKDLESWRGRAFTSEELKGFDVKNIIGKPCTVSVYHNEDGKARIKGVSSAMNGVTIPAMYNAPLWFSIDEHGIPSQQYKAVPEWMKDFIERRVNESQNPVASKESSDFIDDEIPFAWAIALPLASCMIAVASSGLPIA